MYPYPPPEPPDRTSEILPWLLFGVVALAFIVYVMTHLGGSQPPDSFPPASQGQPSSQTLSNADSGPTGQVGSPSLTTYTIAIGDIEGDGQCHLRWQQGDGIDLPGAGVTARSIVRVSSDADLHARIEAM